MKKLIAILKSWFSLEVEQDSENINNEIGLLMAHGFSFDEARNLGIFDRKSIIESIKNTTDKYIGQRVFNPETHKIVPVECNVYNPEHYYLIPRTINKDQQRQLIIEMGSLISVSKAVHAFDKVFNK